MWLHEPPLSSTSVKLTTKYTQPNRTSAATEKFLPDREECCAIPFEPRVNQTVCALSISYLSVCSPLSLENPESGARATFFVQNISRFPIHILASEKRDLGITFPTGIVI